MIAVLVTGVQHFATLWTMICQITLSMGFSKQEYWNQLLFPSPWDLPDPGIELRSSALQADSLPSEPLRKPRIPIYHQTFIFVDPEFGNSSGNHGWWIHWWRTSELEGQLCCARPFCIRDLITPAFGGERGEVSCNHSPLDIDERLTCWKKKGGALKVVNHHILYEHILIKYIKHEGKISCIQT